MCDESVRYLGSHLGRTHQMSKTAVSVIVKLTEELRTIKGMTALTRVLTAVPQPFPPPFSDSLDLESE